MTYKKIITTAATVEPVSLAEAKQQLRVEIAADDAYIAALISAARDRVESYCNRFFTEQTIDILFEESIPAGQVDLPYSDLAAINSFRYYDVDSESILTIASSEYYADLNRQKLINIGSWPSADNYRISATTGSPTELSGVKQAILMIVTDMYELRTESVTGVSIANNPAVKALLYSYRENLGV